MLMTDIASKEEWIELEKTMHERFKLNGRVYDKDGFTFTGHVTWSNPLCPAIKGSPEGAANICSVAHQAMAREAVKAGDVMVSECDAGLVKICCPFVIDDELAGVAGGCGRCRDAEDIDAFLISKATGIEDEEVKRLAADVQLMTEQEIKEAVAFLKEWKRKALERLKTEAHA